MVPSMREKYDTIRHILCIVVSIMLWCVRKFNCSIADRHLLFPLVLLKKCMVPSMGGSMKQLDMCLLLLFLYHIMVH